MKKKTTQKVTNRKSQSFLGLFSCALGFCSVAIGAFGAHALKERFGDYEKDLWKTATTYLMVHALAALVSWMRSQRADSWETVVGGRDSSLWFGRAAALFCLGSVLFSISLFLLALTGTRGLGAITPIGGVCLLLGWASLAVGCFKCTKN
jgi:uncharacterized membrane protein YgdD (TMEM256/DUF423 family)